MGRRNVELGFACGLILQGHEAHQPPNFALDPARQRESNDVFRKCLGRPQWHLLRHHLWNLGPSYLNAEPVEELLILNRPNRSGKMSRTQFCPVPNWESTKNEFQNMSSIAGSKSFVDQNEAVNILQIVSRDEIAMGITYKVFFFLLAGGCLGKSQAGRPSVS